MDKTCMNCKFGDLRIIEPPCDKCFGHSNWVQWVATEAPEKAATSFYIEWFDADLKAAYLQVDGVELISVDQLGNWIFFGKLVGEIRKVLFVINAGHLVSITRLDAPVA